jgi:predicted DNA-binding transcriptional regulator AlpA
MSTEVARGLGLLTREQVCQLFGIESRTEANRRSAGRMPPHIKLGSAIYYARDALEVWMHRNSRTADAPRRPGRPRKGFV